MTDVAEDVFFEPEVVRPSRFGRDGRCDELDHQLAIQACSAGRIKETLVVRRQPTVHRAQPIVDRVQLLMNLIQPSDRGVQRAGDLVQVLDRKVLGRLGVHDHSISVGG